MHYEPDDDHPAESIHQEERPSSCDFCSAPVVVHYESVCIEGASFDNWVITEEYKCESCGERLEWGRRGHENQHADESEKIITREEALSERRKTA